MHGAIQWVIEPIAWGCAIGKSIPIELQLRSYLVRSLVIGSLMGLCNRLRNKCSVLLIYYVNLLNSLINRLCNVWINDYVNATTCWIAIKQASQWPDESPVDVAVANHYAVHRAHNHLCNDLVSWVVLCTCGSIGRTMGHCVYMALHRVINDMLNW